MAALVDALFQRFGLGKSIASRLRASFTIVMTLLLIPSIVSVSMMAHYSLRYHGLIRQVERVASLKPTVSFSIPEELRNVVAGNQKFDQGKQFEMVDHVNDELDSLIESTLQGNLKELIAARRAMNTLVGYINRIGAQIEGKHKVAESEETLEEVRSVASLVTDKLEQYIDAEVAAAAQTSDALNQTLFAILWLLVLLMLLTLIFTVAARHSLSRAIQGPLIELERSAEALALGDLQARAPDTSVEELRALTDSFNIMAYKLERLVEVNRREQENLKKSELRTLQAQIAPHFLYNTLDAIVWLAEARRAEEVIHITRALSDFFRISLSQGKDWIPLSEELKHLTGYLTIQSIRYRDILDYDIDIPESLYDEQVLKLLIQPLVENAIYHGIKHRRGRGRVSIAARAEDGYLTLSVTDNGAGMTPERLRDVRAGLSSVLEEPRGDGAAQGPATEDAVGYGLFNVNQRIKLYYNQPEGVDIMSGESGTTISIRVPLKGRKDV